jgi:ABC-type transport system involved in multi-copper enzyme maturation permease subunit
MGNNELAGIDAGRRPPQNRGTAQAGRILGIISTVLMIIGVVFLFVLLIIGLVASTS